MFVTFCRAIALAASVCVLVGCSRNADKPQASTPQASPKSDDVVVERAKLSPDDRALVEAQEWCAISTDERLGSMGPPLKLDIKGKTVFICCKGCKKKAEDNPERTLAKVEELKAKAKAEREAKK